MNVSERSGGYGLNCLDHAGAVLHICHPEPAKTAKDLTYSDGSTLMLSCVTTEVRI